MHLEREKKKLMENAQKLGNEAMQRAQEATLAESMMKGVAKVNELKEKHVPSKLILEE